MANSTNTLCICSYNSRGFNEEKKDLCKTLMMQSENIPILCNQENFLLQGNGYKIEQCLPESRIFFKKAEKDSLNNGRPKNGMFIAAPKEFKDCARELPTNHWRLQAIMLSIPNSNILILNSYFPTDPKVCDFDTSDLLSTLSAINVILENAESSTVVWTGDINADFLRNTTFTKIVSEFIENKMLCKSWERYQIDFTHLQDIRDKTYTSTLDHFFWSENLSESVIEADVLHIPENTSDHCPIFCKIDVKKLPTISTANKTVNSPNASWRKANESERNNYITLLDERLRTLEVPDEVDRCRNVNCDSKCHIEKIDEFFICILNTIKTTADDCLPCNKKKKVGNSKKKPIAFWRDEVQPYKDKSMFWHSVWISAGRPINTELHRIMKRSRNAYHFQIRKNKKLAENLKKNAFLNACINNNEDIFKLIRKEWATTPSVPNTMDGVSTDIENHFASIYKTLYNSVNDENDLSNYKEHLSKKINPSSIVDAWRITPERVHDAVQRLKNEKNDPVLDFKSDCLKNAPPIFCTQLSLLFRQFLIHGHISSFLMISTLIPLVKEKMGDITSSDNYRSIAISSLILKVFDYVILDIHGAIWIPG